MRYTKHCEDMLNERSISKLWVEQAINEPEKVQDKPDGTRHYLRKMPEYGNRWLRVIINVVEEPGRVVTVFFDRTMKGKK